MPQLYIISGCNGAGKTTASYTILPELLNCKEFVNADEIARGISPFNAASVSVEAGRIMLARIATLMEAGVDFAFETTLAGRAYVKLIRKAQQKGYAVTLIYFWLNSPELAIGRVARRVAAGGHHIAEDVIRRRYAASIHNLFQLYMKEVDFWILVDNSTSLLEIVAEGAKNQSNKVMNMSLYKTIESYD
ncbi:MAG: zeta toxin family protein [Prevotellaceae bacterium]|jgi:predicted ABC-type ATPase|nr:zeta toxin family protein [Prevotellaceae bacterium]